MKNQKYKVGRISCLLTQYISTACPAYLYAGLYKIQNHNKPWPKESKNWFVKECRLRDVFLEEGEIEQSLSEMMTPNSKSCFAVTPKTLFELLYKKLPDCKSETDNIILLDLKRYIRDAPPELRFNGYYVLGFDTLIEHQGCCATVDYKNGLLCALFSSEKEGYVPVKYLIETSVKNRYFLNSEIFKGWLHAVSTHYK